MLRNWAPGPCAAQNAIYSTATCLTNDSDHVLYNLVFVFPQQQQQNHNNSSSTSNNSNNNHNNTNKNSYNCNNNDNSQYGVSVAEAFFFAEPKNADWTSATVAVFVMVAKRENTCVSMFRRMSILTWSKLIGSPPRRHAPHSRGAALTC